ncbi:histidine phosphatase superfamily, partial [Vararia minispora EC-137]
VRHGESTDNLRSVWAGWKDAPLSNHGVSSPRSAGEALSATPFQAIYASPLKRAFTTAQAIYDAQPSPKPSFTESVLIREQHFGVAEGKPWTYNHEPGLSLEEHFARGIWPVLTGDDERFPDGESHNDLAARADMAIEELVMPHVWQAAREGRKGVHVALVSHGLCISHLITQLLKRNAAEHPGGDYRGLLNTAWSRVEVDVKASKEGEPMEIREDDLPPLSAKVTHVNEHSHITDIKRQGGGIGSAAYDPKQEDIRAFFGGRTSALAHAKSNANDEVAEDGDMTANA